MSSVLVDAVRVLTLLNAAVLLGLAYVWGRNWLDLRSKHSLGLLLFAVLLLGENLLGAYLFVLDPTISAWVADPDLVPPPAQVAMAAFRALEFGALAFLTWITWD
ncbi:hypothetical protein N0B31_06840 [Salinirubellus salinus]|uniref:Uncharacterized protein n=1 Tax=Salinirubellus salinus TaxID=1364945 RepID=A0A9E7UCM3_9EURY|nr:hypothetical protein [Salinirubellus salinus]UWM55999.1 hypothetical protein N0B31_06840 [Salinirubellus salinus]